MVGAGEEIAIVSWTGQTPCFSLSCTISTQGLDAAEWPW